MAGLRQSIHGRSVSYGSTASTKSSERVQCGLCTVHGATCLLDLIRGRKHDEATATDRWARVRTLPDVFGHVAVCQPCRLLACSDTEVQYGMWRELVGDG